MKRLFLYAVAIAAFCSSCETDDEVVATSSSTENLNTYLAKNVEFTDFQIYQIIINSFYYNNSITYEKNISLFEKHVNTKILNYYPNDSMSFEKIDLMQLEILQTDANLIIGQMKYSLVTRQIIYDIVNDRYNSLDVLKISDDFEKQLVQTLLSVNDSDDRWNGKRGIAYAYGAQYSIVQAILYAGAFELMHENISN